MQNKITCFGGAGLEQHLNTDMHTTYNKDHPYKRLKRKNTRRRTLINDVVLSIPK